jgi:DNA-binding transcriptional regulator YhcF (GntR family)
MREKSFEEIANRLAQAISSDPAYRLPRIVDLADQYGVSYPTMWKALNVLVGKGLIASRPGKKLAIIAGPDDRSSIGESAQDRLFATIKQRIIDGTYASGKPFPKAGYFAVTEGVSYLTIAQAFVRLRKENLAHKAKNRWIAGPEDSPRFLARRRSFGDAPVVLVLIADIHYWIRYFSDGFNSRFMLPFTAETGNRGIRLAPVLVDTIADELIGMPAGREEIHSAIASLGDQYCGTLIVSVFPAEFDLDKWIIELVNFGKPVVLFDSVGGRGDLTRGRLSHRPVIARYYRCYLDEQKAVDIAVDTLAGHGHRAIGIHGAQAADWAQRRAALIAQRAAEHSPPLACATAGPPEPRWGFSDLNTSEIHSFVSSLADRGAGHPRSKASFRTMLIDEAKSLVSLITRHQATAIIGLNDRMAREYYFWLKAAGMDVPGDMSLISFDNLPHSALMPISTMDFGFERLGYAAAHIFIGDIPIMEDANGFIAGACALVDRGSIGKPADSGKIRRLIDKGR